MKILLEALRLPLRMLWLALDLIPPPMSTRRRWIRLLMRCEILTLRMLALFEYRVMHTTLAPTALLAIAYKRKRDLATALKTAKRSRGRS